MKTVNALATATDRERKHVILSIDFEDYRYITCRDHNDPSLRTYPKEVERQLETLLLLLEHIDAKATFFASGKLKNEINSGAWKSIIRSHRVGCHGFEHARVREQGPKLFREDLYRAKSSLEDATCAPVTTYRAPYFSCDGCDPWFGEMLESVGFELSSSRRVPSLPTGSKGTISIPGTSRVIEVPLRSIGFGSRRIGVIGGSYFRFFTFNIISKLLKESAEKNFYPMIYLHNYEMDTHAKPINFSSSVTTYDMLRRLGRGSVINKLQMLASSYQMLPLESVLEINKIL